MQRDINYHTQQMQAGRCIVKFKASIEATMNPKELSTGQTNSRLTAIFTNKATIYALIKLFLVAMILIFGTLSAYAIIAAATKEPITLIGLGLMGLVAASTYIKS